MTDHPFLQEAGKAAWFLFLFIKKVWVSDPCSSEVECWISNTYLLSNNSIFSHGMPINIKMQNVPPFKFSQLALRKMSNFPYWHWDYFKQIFWVTFAPVFNATNFLVQELFSVFSCVLFSLIMCNTKLVMEIAESVLAFIC